MPLNLRSSTQYNNTINVTSPTQSSPVSRSLEKLRESWDTPILKLEGQQKTMFWEVVDTVRTTYPIPDEYEVLYDEIKQRFIFTDTSRSVEVGTVGAYFGGCLINNNGCSAVCAGSVPAPRGHRFCDSHVYMADFDSDENTFHFTRTFQGSDTVSRAIVYVRANNLDEFQGFTQVEKAALANNNIQSVSIMNQRNSQDTPRVIGESGFTDLEDVKSRVGVARVIGTNGYNGWAIFGLIVVIVIICIIIWLIVRESKRSVTPSSTP